jgi:hypothetical protein
MNDDHDDDGGHGDDQVLQTWKRRKRKTKWALGKGIFDRTILLWWSRHLVIVITFRIDSRTIKRSETRRENTVIKVSLDVLIHCICI